MSIHKKIDSFPNEGWKAHINVPENADSPVTQAIANYCKINGIPYKVGKSDQPGKGMTLYLGDRLKLERAVLEIESLMIGGSRIQIPDMIGIALEQDMPIGQGKIYARFHPVHYQTEQAQLTRYGFKGLPYIEIDNLILKNWDHNPQLQRGMTQSQFKDYAWIRSYKYLENVYGSTFTGVALNEVPEWAKPHLNMLARPNTAAHFTGHQKATETMHVSQATSGPWAKLEMNRGAGRNPAPKSL